MLVKGEPQKRRAAVHGEHTTTAAIGSKTSAAPSAISSAPLQANALVGGDELTAAESSLYK